ncbi:possible ABC transporter, ATP-binding component [Prochlorococcus marinus str. MIT 9515]|uniref:Possible ABC transporter, ATP-binding component n=1 Tax=Prochlorococcus marinus (strain MIT 9515) TaxID=167542 RepID=A2BVY7_PROM5|nr:ABC transporter ATP-binding protein [Prochlorococcus marinus]ABM71948.1 possible ABC transporter, ATP-binding component [Prochlorococcus marinus str. MIT 9515]
MLDLREITYQPQTGSEKILDDISFNVHENELILICGNSGAGKTTLLEIISGLTIPQKGSISWKNKTISARQRRWISGVVFQFPERYFLGTTVGKELKFGHKSLREKNIDIVLKKVGLSGINLAQAPEKLSGGQQRRLAVAVQLMRNPTILLLDEPTAGLDWSMKNDVKNLVHNLQNKNTIIIVTHEPSLFEGIPYKIITLEKGKIKKLMKEHYGG